MAKYTECLADYLNNGHSLPTVFSQITDFDKLFTGFYCASEIGFETEDLFEIRLETKAQLIVPLYAQRISTYTTLIAQLGTPNKQMTLSHTGNDSGSNSTINSGTDAVAHTGTVGHSGTVNAGQQAKRHTELPINASTATPSSTDVADAYTNSDSRTETYNNTDTTTHGLSVTGNHTNTNSYTDTHTYTGLDINEQLNLVKYYESKILNLKQACLDEFKTLFMVIY